MSPSISLSSPIAGMGRARRVIVPLLVLVLAASGCDENDSFFAWTASPDTAVLYSLSRPELTLLSAFNFNQRSTVRIETMGAGLSWDIALDTRGGQLVLLTPGALGLESHARVARLPGMTFDEIIEAPEDSLLYSETQPVPLDLTSAYVVRTDLRGSPYGGTCVFYAKLQPLTIDVAEGSLKFVFDASPLCNDRMVVPPENDRMVVPPEPGS
jgi:hypothetical protein